jgi:hypothetical protein
MKDKASISHKPPFLNRQFPTAKREISQLSPEKILVRRIPLKELVVYDLREDELEALINGVRVSNYQAHATWSLSMAVAFLSLVIVPGLPNILLAVCTFLMAFGFGAGFILLFISFRQRKSLNETVAKIKARSSF